MQLGLFIPAEHTELREYVLGVTREHQYNRSKPQGCTLPHQHPLHLVFSMLKMHAVGQGQVSKWQLNMVKRHKLVQCICLAAMSF